MLVEVNAGIDACSITERKLAYALWKFVLCRHLRRRRKTIESTAVRALAGGVERERAGGALRSRVAVAEDSLIRCRCLSRGHD